MLRGQTISPFWDLVLCLHENLNRRALTMSTEWPTTHRESKHMAMRQRQNRGRKIPAEKWMAEKLKQTPWKWTPQSRQGYRLFDFWSYELGAAIEVDGPDHVCAVDEAKDTRELLRSGIVGELYT